MMVRCKILCACLLLLLHVLPFSTTKLMAEESAELKKLRAEYQQVLKDIAEVNKKGDRSKMLDLINKMSSLRLSIQELEMAGKKSPYDKMSIDELNVEMKKLMQKAQEASKSGKTQEAQGLWRKYSEVAKLYSYKSNRALSGKMDASTRVGNSAENKLKYFTAMEAMRWLSKGQLERGINGYEAIVENGLNTMTLGVAINLAQIYFDFLSDAKRALALIERVIAYSEQKIGSGIHDLQDIDERSSLIILHGARNARFRFLSHLGELDRMEKLLVDDVAEWEDDEKRFLEKRQRPYDAMSFQFLFSGNFNLGAQLRFAAECCEKKGKSQKASAYRKRAIKRYNKIIEIINNSKADKSLKMTWDMTCKAMLARLIRDEEGLAASLKAYEVYQEAENKWHRSQNMIAYGFYYLLTRLEYAEILTGLGRFDEALAAAKLADERFNAKDPRQGMAAYKALKWKPSYIMGTICEKKGDLTGAIKNYIRAIEQIEELYSQMRSGKMKGQFLKINDCSECYRRLVRLLLKSGREKEAFEYLERSKSAVLLDMLRSLPMRERKNWPKKLLEREKKLKGEMKKNKKILEEGDSSGASSGNDGKRSQSSAEASNALRKARWDYELLLRNIASHMATLAEEKSANRFDKVWYQKASNILAVTKKSPEKTLVEYFNDGKSISCFVIRGKELKSLPCGSTKKIRKLVNKLRRHISSKSKRWKKSAKTLYKALVKPWEDELQNCNSLVIVPTGFLHSLPFNCLINGEGKMLVELFPISVLSQASLLVGAEGKANVGKGRLVFADPDGSLPNARVEAKDILAAAGKECTVRYGEDANEGWLKERLGFLPHEAKHPAVLHMATHGLLEKGMNLFSSLVLSQTELEDGALTVGEIFNELDLRKTPVVVLSACNTALGDEGGGDEIVGLSRAFQYAGARWVVASLWEVSDEASAKLMKSFHEELVVGDEIMANEALAKAQRTISAQKEWSHPFYWAAFVPYKR